MEEIFNIFKNVVSKKFELDVPTAVHDFAIQYDVHQCAMNIYCGCHDGQLLTLDLSQNCTSLIKKFPNSIGQVSIINKSNGEHLLLGGEIGACIVNISGEILWHYEPEGTIRGVVYFPSTQDNIGLIAVADDNKIILLNSNNSILKCYESPEIIYSLRIIRYSHNNDMDLIFGTRKGDINIIDQDFRLKWVFRTGTFVRAVYATDINKSGTFQVVAGDGKKRVYVIDTNGRLLFDPLEVSDRIQTVYMGDIDSDGNIEIVVGTRDGVIHFFDIKTQQIKWRFMAKDWPSSIKQLQNNKDNNKLVISTGQGLTIYCVNSFQNYFKKVNKVWYDKSKTEKSKIFSTLQYHDKILLSTLVDDWVLVHPEMLNIFEYKMQDRVRTLWKIDSTKNEFDYILAGTESGLYKLKAQNDHIELEKKLLSAVIRRVYPFMHDGSTECFIVATGDGGLYLLSDDGSLKNIFKTSKPISSVFCKDVDLDLEKEIIIGSEDSNLYVLDQTGRIQACYRNAPNFVRAVFSEDVDNDGEIEIISGMKDIYLDALTLVGRLKWRFKIEGKSQRWIWAITSAGYFKNKAVRIIASSNNCKLYSINGKTGKVECSYESTQRIHTLHSCKLIGSNNHIILAASSNGIQMFDTSLGLLKDFSVGRVSTFWINDIVDPKNIEFLLAVNGKHICKVRTQLN